MAGDVYKRQIEILSNASNWSGMLNQANYVEKLYEYDKQMLNRYILIKEEVAQKKNDLEDKKSDLEKMCIRDSC